MGINMYIIWSSMLQTKHICQCVLLPYLSPNFWTLSFLCQNLWFLASPHLPRYVSAKSTSLNSAGLPARIRCKVAKDFFLKTVMVGWCLVGSLLGSSTFVLFLSCCNWTYPWVFEGVVNVNHTYIYKYNIDRIWICKNIITILLIYTHLQWPSKGDISFLSLWCCK